MSAGETREAVIEFRFVLLAAYGGGDEVEAVQHLGKSAQRVLGLVLPVWVAATQQVGARLAEHVLHSLGEEEGEGEGEAEAEPGGVPFPDFAAPSVRFECPGVAGGWTGGWEDDDGQEGQDEGGNDGDDKEGCSGNFFVFDKGERDVRVGEGERAAVGGDLPETGSDTDDGTEVESMGYVYG